MRLPRWFVSLGLACAVLAHFGCSKREEPLLVDGRSHSTLRAWRSASSPQLPVAKWREFDAALDEIRFELQREDPTLAHNEAVDAAARKVHGKTIDQALREGDLARLRRLTQMAEQLKTMVDTNALIVPKPGDPASAEALHAKLKDQSKRRSGPAGKPSRRTPPRSRPSRIHAAEAPANHANRREYKRIGLRLRFAEVQQPAVRIHVIRPDGVLGTKHGGDPVRPFLADGLQTCVPLLGRE